MKDENPLSWIAVWLSALVVVPVMTVVCVVGGLVVGIHDLFSANDNQWGDTI